ncbi:MAG: EAL domain-containing protein [Cyanobacteria bacterium P01_F01_bin.150]
MNRSPLLLAPDCPLLIAITCMSQGPHTPSSLADSIPFTRSVLSRSSYALVVENKQLIGIITERDIVRLVSQNVDFASQLVADVMTPAPITLVESEADQPFRALEILRQHRIRHLPVVNNRGEVVGVITQNTIRQNLQSTDLLTLRRVEDVMTVQVIYALTDSKAIDLAQLMASHRVSCIVIIQEASNDPVQDRIPMGIVTEHDIVQYKAMGLDLTTLESSTIMSSPLVCLKVQDDLWTAHQTMDQMRVRRLVVTDEQDRLAGIVTQTSILMTLDPIEMQRTIMLLTQQVEQLENERVQLAQAKAVELEQQLQATENRFQAIFNQTFQFIGLLDPEGTLLEANQTALEVGGIRLEDVVNRPFWEARWWATSPETPQELKAAIAQARQGKFVRYTVDVLTADDQIITVDFSLRPMLDEHGQVVLLIPEGRDITELKQAHMELAQLNQEFFREKELAQVTLQSIADAVITTNAQGEIQYINPVAEQLTGWPASEAQGLPLREVFNIINEITRNPVDNPIERVLKEGRIAGLANHTVLISANGVEYGIEDSAAPIRDRAGNMIGAVMVFHDVTQSRQLARQLSWQALHDPLTELPNRFQFEQALGVILDDVGTALKSSQNNALCYLDLDQFKVVNDTCGHVAGDELLRQLSHLLKYQLRSADLLARLGGDEFGVLLRHCLPTNAEAIAEKLRKAVHSFRFIWNNQTFSIGVSIGLVFLDSTFGTLDEILSAADAACYAAKEGGRNRVHIYQVDDSDLMRQRGERQWSVLIKQALEEDRFCLYHQPIVERTSANDAQPALYEVLMRMVDGQGQLILPGSFIPAAERYDLMPAIDRWVIQTFFSQLSSFMAHPSHPVSQTQCIHFINLSGASIGDDQFLNFLTQQFEQYQILPQAIGFEITETEAIANLNQATRCINQLHDLGCAFALDDFGSGMSSFGYLKNLSVDYLKIDGHFVADIKADPMTYAIVESINHIGHVMGLKTIAESVEDSELREMLAQIDVDYVQGNGIASPRPIAFAPMV